MSHELTTHADGRVEFAYSGAPGWHGLGQEVPANSSLEEWELASGMGFTIKRSKVRYYADREGNTQLEMPERHVLFRSDTKAALGLVSDGFKVVQPKQVLKHMHELCSEIGFEMETAGTLFGGKKFWSLARIGESAMILDRDPVVGYLLLVTACDGSMKTTAKYLATRIVCNNTLTMGLNEGSKEIKVSHRTAFDWAVVKDQLGIVQGSFAKAVADMRALAAIKVTPDVAETIVHELLRPITAERLNTTKRAPRGLASILDLFAGTAKGSTIPGVRGTAWGLLNAITEHVDHHASASTDSHRMDSAWFNGGDDLKTTAFARLLAMT